jgi:hypothetical protein
LTAERAAQDGIDAQEREGTVGYAECGDLFGFGYAGDAERVAIVGADVDETFILLAEDEVGGGGDVQIGDVEAWGFLPDAH